MKEKKRERGKIEMERKREKNVKLNRISKER